VTMVIGSFSAMNEISEGVRGPVLIAAVDIGYGIEGLLMVGRRK
jgi:hypothetical protein